MKCIEISKPGGPEVLVPAERPAPAPKANEILVKVAAAGVNRPDVLQRMGHYPVPPDASDLPGLEIAGEVAACGAGVTLWKPGDKVCALVHGGGYAEYCVAPEVQALPMPKGFSADRGGVAAGNLLHRLVERLRPRAARAGRIAAGAGRHLRHRRHRDPDGGGDGQPRLRHRGQRREVRRLRQARRREGRSTTRRRISSPRSRRRPAARAST